MPETIFGQIVVGPPGSGKSTYCKFICENLRQLGRNAQIINLDPANDCLPYKPSIDITKLINVESVMQSSKLGPNGAMIHCMETLDGNFGWLYDHIVDLIDKAIKESQDGVKKMAAEEEKGAEEKRHDTNRSRPYLLIDCPGQTELYTHNKAMPSIIKRLTDRHNKHFNLRLTCMNLCDAYHASDLGKYIGLVMNSLTTMLNLELPHVNVLSKVDMIDTQNKTRFNLDFYCEVMDLRYLFETELEHPFYRKFRQLSEALISTIEDYGLVSFIPLNIQQAEDIHRVLQMADKANGYYVDDLDLSILQLNPKLMEMASGRRLEPLNDATISQSNPTCEN